MLTVIRDAHGSLLAACDWWLVDAEGRWDPKGAYVWVEQLEFSVSTTDGVAVIRQIIQDISVRAPWTHGAYWERRDKTFGGGLHAFRREQLVKEVRV